MRALLALAALAAIATAIALSAQPGSRQASTSPPPTITATAVASPAATRTPAPPQLDRVAINRQDRVSRSHRVREARAYDSRPLLTRLPLTRGGVRIDIAGLAADDHTAVLAIDPGQRTRAHALAVYQRELRRHDELAHQRLERHADSGESYVLEWAR